MSVASPCTNICQLNADNICIGCLRTRGEIANWSMLSDPERYSINASLDRRRETLPNLIPNE